MNNINQNDAIASAFNKVQQFQLNRHYQSPRPQISTAKLRRAFDIELPKTGKAAIDVIEQLHIAAEPGLVGNTGPNFFGWVMGSSSQAGVAADMLTSAWGQNAGIFQTSPSAAIAEEVAAKWLLDVLDLPPQSSVGFTTGATMASFIGLAAARTEVLRRQGWDLTADGLVGAPATTVIVSEEAHASVIAVLTYLGFGERKLIRIPTDAQGRMHIPLLEKAMANVNGACIVVAQAGHINSGAFDRLERIGALAKKHDAWFHIDGAFGLWARCSLAHRDLARGAELADSWAVDGHKWLQVPYDSGYAIVKNAHAHRAAMNISASYLNQSDADGRNPSAYCPELSRRARGFTTWAMLQSLGRNGLSEMVERHCACARRIQTLLQDVPGVRILNTVWLNQLAISFDDPLNSTEHDQSSDSDVRNSRTTNAVINEIQRENTSFVSGANWKGVRILRVSVIAEHTRIQDVDRLATSIVSAWDKVQQKLEVTKATMNNEQPTHFLYSEPKAGMWKENQFLNRRSA